MDQTAYFEQMRQKRKSEILLAARELLLEEGLHAFTMQKLARSLDISTVTLYKYFKNSTDLMCALRQHALQSCSTSGILLPSTDDPLKDFLSLFPYCYEELKKHRADVTLIMLIDSYLRSHQTPVHAAALPYPGDFHERQTALLAAARERGQIASSLAIPGTLELINGLCGSFFGQLALMQDEEFQAREPEIRRQVTEMADLFRAWLTCA